jgi:CheY-like chemotaxis protein
MKNVLVVEDAADCAYLLAKLLELNGHTVQVAENGQVALERMERFRPDVVLLDMMMPVMDGMTFLEHCRMRPDGRGVRVVVFTGYGQTLNARRLAELGVSEVHLKGATDFGQLVNSIGVECSAA